MEWWNGCSDAGGRGQWNQNNLGVIYKTMKKTYWWRIVLSMASLAVVAWSFIYDIYICLPVSEGGCPFFLYRKYFLEPIAFFSIAFSFLSLFLFFVSDVVFKKWLGFALVWLIFSFFLISIAPDDTGLWLPMRPDKEIASLWLSVLFVPISLGILLFASWKERQASK